MGGKGQRRGGTYQERCKCIPHGRKRARKDERCREGESTSVARKHDWGKERKALRVLARGVAGLEALYNSKDRRGKVSVGTEESARVKETDEGAAADEEGPLVDLLVVAQVAFAESRGVHEGAERVAADCGVGRGKWRSACCCCCCSEARVKLTYNRHRGGLLHLPVREGGSASREQKHSLEIFVLT